MITHRVVGIAINNEIATTVHHHLISQLTSLHMYTRTSDDGGRPRTSLGVSLVRQRYRPRPAVAPVVGEPCVIPVERCAPPIQVEDVIHALTHRAACGYSLIHVPTAVPAVRLLFVHLRTQPLPPCIDIYPRPLTRHDQRTPSSNPASHLRQTRNTHAPIGRPCFTCPQC